MPTYLKTIGYLIVSPLVIRNIEKIFENLKDVYWPSPSKEFKQCNLRPY